MNGDTSSTATTGNARKHVQQHYSSENGDAPPHSNDDQENHESNKPSATSTIEPPTDTVCCGCRPKRGKYRKTSQKLRQSLRNALSFFRIGKHSYYDAPMGQDTEWHALARNIDESGSNTYSQYFFDAVDEPLEEEEYPIDGYVVKTSRSGSTEIVEDYPIIFTTTLQHPKPRVSLDDPTSMLRKSIIEASMRKAAHSVAIGDEAESEEHSIAFVAEGEEQSEAEQRKEKSKQRQRRESRDSNMSVFSRTDSIQSHKEPSMRFHKIKRRPTLEHKAQLEEPRVKSHGLRGYPGELTEEELLECQKFIRGLKQLEPSVTEQVYSFRDVEEEPYTICRWLRATKFDADKILERLQSNQEIFDKAKMDEFYPNVADAIGAPLSVFLSQYPFLPVGRGKNGCPVNFFLAGKINPEGILALTTPHRLQRYFWYSFLWKFKEEIRQAQEIDPDFVRLEGINILDLEGLSSSALSSETMNVIKIASKISDFFPETLHCMLVLNAPSFFAFSWGIIKKFIDPRTAARIQLFSNKEKGQSALEKLIDKSELPSDYGGDNVSLEKAFLKEAKDSSLIRQEIELLHCKRKCKKHTEAWQLEKMESMEITIYTRSVSTAEITIKLNGATFQTLQLQCLFGRNEEDEDNDNSGDDDMNVDDSSAKSPMPNHVVIKNLVGPGKVTVEAKDLDDADKEYSGMSRGYFLVVGDVRKASKERPKAKLQQQHKASVTMAGLTTSSDEKPPASKKKRVIF